MAAPWYTVTGSPVTGSPGASAVMRSEFANIAASFALMPSLTAGTAIVVNAGGTALTNTLGTLALGAGFATTGGYGTTLIEQAATSLTLPATSDTLVGRSTTDTLSNKTFVSLALGTPVSGNLANCTNLPNAGLVNSAITIGSTPVALGATATTIAGLTLTNPIVGTQTAKDNSTKAASTAYVDSATVNPNVIIDGDFRINQRIYISAATLAAGKYGHDRWKAGASGGDYSFSQLGSPTTITIAANKSLIQVIEAADVAAGTYTLSWTGTAVGRLTINSATPSGNFAASPITVSGQNAGTTMSLELTGANAAGGSTIATNAGTASTVKLEAGSTTTPFVPDDYALALIRCQRFCYQTLPDGTSTNQRIGIGYAQSNLIAQIFVTTPVQMRVAPTLTAIGTCALYDGVTATALSSISLTANSGTTRELSIDCSVVGGLTQYRPYALIANASSTAAIRLESEL